MMMRVTRTPDDGERARLLVEGRLTADGVPELSAQCEAVAKEHGGLRLDVSGLRFADQTGIETLLRIEAAGAELFGASGFLGALLRDGAQAAPGSDDALVAGLKAGNEEAFETLVRRHGGRMLATARRMMAVEDEAQDVVQDAFLAAFRSVGSFQGTSLLSTWLHRIVVNAALMRLRTRRRRPEESIDDLLPRFDEDGRFAEPMGTWNADTVTTLERGETRALVRRAIDRLPETYRTVLLLRDIEDLDTEETAARLGIRPNAVKTRLHRARLALRTLLARDLGEHDVPTAASLGLRC
jgi:RNA polymerase sigma-70 factor (ECF subfamily)